MDSSQPHVRQSNLDGESDPESVFGDSDTNAAFEDDGGNAYPPTSIKQLGVKESDNIQTEAQQNSGAGEVAVPTIPGMYPRRIVSGPNKAFSAEYL
jgi:hypothetical protein